ncbi:MAG TPA: hypothetical protein DEB39_02475 [Planctomycetaceae bacterium]|nr:hypothetical protein [Planctomycetaceae bacterium]
MKRRTFLTSSLALTGTAFSLGTSSPLVAGPLTPGGGEKPEEHITAYVVDSKPEMTYEAWIRRNNVSLTSYRAFKHQKYPYFFPVAGPVSGLSLTTETSLPWPHHRSVFFGCDKVNGGNYWQGTLRDGQIVSQGVSLGEVTETSCRIKDRCLWGKPLKPLSAGESPEPDIIEDTRLFELKLLEGTVNYVIDADITMKALVDVKVERTNHGLYGVRVSPELAPDGGGNLVNSNGKRGQKETEGKPANWMAYYGRRSGLKEEIVEGIAVMIHPRHPDTEAFPTFKNCPWFTRDYGNCSPMPMNFMSDPLTLPKGESIRLKYRIVAFAGTPENARLDALWEDFAST